MDALNIEDHWGRNIEEGSTTTSIDDLPSEALVFEPRETYDKGLLGTIIAGEERVALYSREKIIQALAADNDLEAHEAEEWVDYNTIGAYVGPHTPVVTE
tara:strand:+ start:429 stop:728 length:300 start_codon:yes stop_codon:yes gene_type:complete